MAQTTAERILEAAEIRVRQAGYNGFSFRDLAEDVGIKSASVHHHFATKEALVARMATDYTDRFIAALEEAPPGPPRVARVKDLFRQSVLDDGKMCLCGMLGAEGIGLPPSVTRETKRFFEALVAALAESMGTWGTNRRTAALRLVAQLEGAVLLARAHMDPTVFDEVVDGP
ncbi:MAG: TetR/AcrR family transcriptional regulator [Pseudomonadota bacterium]